MGSFSAYVEVGEDDWCTVWVAELPGFFLNEPSEKNAVKQLTEAIRAYLRWLRRHGERIEVPRTIRYQVAKRETHRARIRYGWYWSLWPWDRALVTHRDIDQALRWMGYNREDLLRLIRMLPPGAMEWRRRPRHRFSVKGYLEHIADTERWYLQRFPSSLPRLKRPASPLERLGQTRALVEQTLRRLSKRERIQIVRRYGELWSRRKMLRAFVYHERYHIRSIARIAIERRIRVPAGLGGWHRYL